MRLSKLKLTAAILGMALAVQVAPIHADSVHKAENGDTFYKLSKQYNVSLNTLMNANPTIKATNIYKGLDIVIPGKTQMTSKAAAEAVPVSVSNANSLLQVFSDQKKVIAWGKSFTYSSTLNVKATAYSAAASENGKWGAVDYFGDPLELGTIAVDPSVIPLGTKVLVTGHSHDGLPKKAFVATAKDAGSAIKGNRIDIFIPGSQKSVRDFGYQDVKLYFIK